MLLSNEKIGIECVWGLGVEINNQAMFWALWKGLELAIDTKITVFGDSLIVISWVWEAKGMQYNNNISPILQIITAWEVWTNSIIPCSKEFEPYSKCTSQ